MEVSQITFGAQIGFRKYEQLRNITINYSIKRNKFLDCFWDQYPLMELFFSTNCHTYVSCLPHD